METTLGSLADTPADPSTGQRAGPGVTRLLHRCR